ncbi:MAG: hypothetical protein ACLVAW_10060 [Eisenbergiella massiliensis]
MLTRFRRVGCGELKWSGRVGGEGVEGMWEGKLYCKRRRMGVDLCICNWYNYRYKLLINMLQIKIINMGKEYGFFV